MHSLYCAQPFSQNGRAVNFLTPFRCRPVVPMSPYRCSPSELRAAALVAAALMGLLELCLLLVGCLTTGPTRERLGNRARVGGRLSCALLLALSYLALLAWLALALFMALSALLCALAGALCNQLRQEQQCLDLRQLGERDCFSPPCAHFDVGAALCGGGPWVSPVCLSLYSSYSTFRTFITNDTKGQSGYLEPAKDRLRKFGGRSRLGKLTVEVVGNL